MLQAKYLSYGYTKSSDVDIHVILNMNEIPTGKTLKNMYVNAIWKKSWHDYHFSYKGVTIQVTPKPGYPVYNSATYSLMQHKWLTKPVPYNSVFSKQQIRASANKWIKNINQHMQAYKKSGANLDCQKIQQLNKKIAGYRTKGLESMRGVLSLPNITYRLLYHIGSIQRLRKVVAQCEERSLSME